MGTFPKVRQYIQEQLISRWQLHFRKRHIFLAGTRMPRGRKEEEKGKTSIFLDETAVQQKLSHGSASNTLPPGIGENRKRPRKTNYPNLVFDRWAAPSKKACLLLPAKKTAFKKWTSYAVPENILKIHKQNACTEYMLPALKNLKGFFLSSCSLFLPIRN